MGFLIFFRGNITDVWKIRNTATLFPAYRSLSPPAGLLLSHQLYLWCNSKKTDVTNDISLIPKQWYVQFWTIILLVWQASTLWKISDLTIVTNYDLTNIIDRQQFTFYIYHLFLLIINYILLFATNNRRTSTVLVNCGLHVSISFNILSELLRAPSLVYG